MLWARTDYGSKMHFHFPLMFHQHFCCWSITWQFPCICETPLLIFKMLTFTIVSGFVVEEGEAVLKAVPFWWLLCLCVPRKYALVFGVFLEQGAYDLPQYHAVKSLSFWGLFFANSEAQIAVLRVLYLKDWNCLYAVLFLYVKISLVIYFS